MAASGASMPIKVQIGDAAYRVRVGGFSELLHAVQGFAGVESPKMQYQDQDSDLINLSSDQEFAEALNVVEESSMSCLKVVVSIDSKKKKGKHASSKAKATADAFVRRTIGSIQQAIDRAVEDYRITTGGQDVPTATMARATSVLDSCRRKAEKLAEKLGGSPKHQLRNAFARLQQRGASKAAAPVQKAESKFVSDLVDSSDSDSDRDADAGKAEAVDAAAAGDGASAEADAQPEPEDPGAASGAAAASDETPASASASTSAPGHGSIHRLLKGDLIRLVMTALPSMANPMLHAGLKAIVRDPMNAPLIEELKKAAENNSLDMQTAVEMVRSSGRILPGVRTFAKIAPDVCTALLPTLIELLTRLGFDKDEVIAAHMQGSMDGQAPDAKKEREELCEEDAAPAEDPVLGFLLDRLPPFVKMAFLGGGRGRRGCGGGRRHHGGAGGGRGRGRGRGRRFGHGGGCGWRRCRGKGDKGAQVDCEDPRFELAMKALFGGDAEDETELVQEGDDDATATAAAAAPSGVESAASGAGSGGDELPVGDAAAEAAAEAQGTGADESVVAALMMRMGLPLRATQVRHRGVVCDGCGMAPIIGPRFKSATKKNYDLCAICERKEAAKRGDVYLKINHPGQAPAGISVMLRDEAEQVGDEAKKAGRGAWRKHGCGASGHKHGHGHGHGRHWGGRRHCGGGGGGHWRKCGGLMREMFAAMCRNGGMPGQEGDKHVYFGPDARQQEEESASGAAAPEPQASAPPAYEQAQADKQAEESASPEEIEMQKAIQASLDADDAARRAKKAVESQNLVGTAAAVAGAVHVALEEQKQSAADREMPMISLQPAVEAKTEEQVTQATEDAADAAASGAGASESKEAEAEAQQQAPASVPMVPLAVTGAPAAATAAAAMVMGTPAVDTRPQARFVSQTTLSHDLEAIYPGVSIVKAWRVENNGSVSWPAGCRVVSVQGESMGTPAEGIVVNREEVRPGKQHDVCLRLTAPQEPGRHQGYWRLMTATGTPFGHRLWVDITVENSNLSSVMSSIKESIGQTAARQQEHDEAAEQAQKAVEERLAADKAAAEQAVAAAAQAEADAEAAKRAEETESESAPAAQEGGSAATGGAAAEESAADAGADADAAAQTAAQAEVDAAFAALQEATAVPSIELDDPSYERYREQLEALHGMGLRNQPLLVHHLDAQKGDVQRVVQALWGN